MQKAIIVTDRENLRELNSLLEKGWKVIHSCPMPAYGTTTSATCLVVLEVNKRK